MLVHQNLHPNSNDMMLIERGKLIRFSFVDLLCLNQKVLGYFGGDLVDKCKTGLLPVLFTMYERLGKDVVEIAIRCGDIQFIPMETIKGMRTLERVHSLLWKNVKM